MKGVLRVLLLLLQLYVCYSFLMDLSKKEIATIQDTWVEYAILNGVGEDLTLLLMDVMKDLNITKDESERREIIKDMKYWDHNEDVIVPAADLLTQRITNMICKLNDEMATLDNLESIRKRYRTSYNKHNFKMLGEKVVNLLHKRLGKTMPNSAERAIKKAFKAIINYVEDEK